EPRILGIRIKPIPLHDGRHALLIRIPKSWNPPHAVLHNRSRLVFARNSAGVHEASVDEMRSMFTAGATLLEQARAFQAQRMAIVHEGNGPFSNFGGEGGRLVMHLIPFSAFGSDVMLEPARLLGAYLPPLWSTGFNHGYNVDGYYTHCERNGLGGYVQVFRNGIVESAAGDVRDRQQDRDPIIYATSVEDQIATKAHDYLAALQNAGVAPPVLIMVAGGRMAGTTVIGNP